MNPPSPNPPSTRSKAFSCPHCGAFADQTWFKLGATRKEGAPFFDTAGARQNLATLKIDSDGRARMLSFLDRLDSGEVFFDGDSALYNPLCNIDISRCRSCNKVALWIANRLLHPVHQFSIPPHPDLPPDIHTDYLEAAAIHQQSPRGAAALLRLAIQKLCTHLGETEKTIDAAIGSLVKKGLSGMVQQALDIVRVVGNEAVHPGTIDLRDDQATVERLFTLVNLITEQMIATPKHIQAMYAALPPEKLKGIEQRDANAKPKDSDGG